MEEKIKFAVFIDFDNIEIGVKSTLGREFDVSLVLEALKERGEVVTKFAYGNWKMAGRHSEKMASHAVHMIQRDPSPRGDKNGGDINLAMDALEMAFTHEFINAFVIVGGDSDFISLVEKLKQYNKAIYIVGGRGFTSTILQKNCREFISYENLIGASDEAPAVPPEQVRRPRRAVAGGKAGGRIRKSSPAPAAAAVAAPKVEDGLPLSNVVPLLQRALKVLSEREHEPLLGLVKSTMIQLDSTFTERDYGVSSFLDFAEKLAAAGLVHVHRHNGNYQISLAGDQPTSAPSGESREDEALRVLSEVLLEAAQRGRKEFHIHGLKQFVSKLRPGFDERKFGFKQFSALMNLAHDRGLVSIAPDERGAMRVRTIIEASKDAADMPGESRQHHHDHSHLPSSASGSDAGYSDVGEDVGYETGYEPVEPLEAVASAPMEEVTVPTVPEAESFTLEPGGEAPQEQPSGTRRRKKPAAASAPASGAKKTAKPRTPRKKKSPDA